MTSSGNGPRCITQPESVIIPNNKDEWSSSNEIGAWIMFDFKGKQVKINCYQIKTFDGREGTMHMKSWKVEISYDGYTWREIDDVVDSNELNGPNFVITRQIVGHDDLLPYRYIRISQTDTNHFRTNCMTLKQVEFYGTMN